MDKTPLFTFKINEMRQVIMKSNESRKVILQTESLVLFFVCNLINVSWFKEELDSCCNIVEKSINFEG